MKQLYRHTLAPLVISAAAAAFALVALSGGLIYRAWWSSQFQNETIKNCQAIEEIKGAIRQVFIDSRDRARVNPRISPEDRKLIETYYRRQLERFGPRDCHVKGRV